jgi:UDP-N-acetylglucosamine diphosphorylase/glucosamine-1-phosphate N-acetyltransferase
MKAVILAAGKSTRTHPLTLARPKALVKIGNRPILQWNLEALDGKAEEVIVVVGFMNEMVKKRFGNSFRGIRIRYAEQEKQLGTANALLAAEPYLEGKFMVMMGDDIYMSQAVERMAGKGSAVLVEEVRDASRFGVWTEKAGKVVGFEEKPKSGSPGLANCGFYILDMRIFSHIRKLDKSERGEYELNEAVNALAAEDSVRVVGAGGGWIPVGYPWDILEANERVLGGMKPANEGEVEPHATIKGNVRIGKGTLVKNGCYIEGPAVIGENCVLGPNCFIMGKTSIGDDCRIGNAVEIKNSVIGDRTNVCHLSYLGDSVVGDDVNVAAGNITANLRHDKEEVMCLVKGRPMGTGRRKFGAVLADGVRTGISTSFYPGRKLWPGQTTLPGEIVKRDKA